MTTSGQDQFEGGGLRVRFVPCGDRVSHEVAVNSPDGWTVVLTSIEGDPSQDWPPSPPLQSLHIERPPGEHERALLVGMAGRSHWSASVVLDAPASRLRFDIACRVPAGLASRLGVAYRSHWPVVEIDPRRARLKHANESGSPNLVIDIDPLYPGTHLEPTADSVSILAGDAAAIDASHTIRWAYTLSFALRGSLA